MHPCSGAGLVGVPFSQAAQDGSKLPGGALSSAQYSAAT